MTHGSNSRIGIARGREAEGANVEAVMSNSGGISRPRLRRASSRKASDSRPNTTDHSGATVPDFHRLPSATRPFTIRPLAALSIERASRIEHCGDASILQNIPERPAKYSRPSCKRFLTSAICAESRPSSEESRSVTGLRLTVTRAIREEAEWAIPMRRRVLRGKEAPVRSAVSC